MDVKRRVARALAVFAVAIGMGHVVQTLSERRNVEAESAAATATPKAVVPVAAGPQTADLQKSSSMLPGVIPVVTATVNTTATGLVFSTTRPVTKTAAPPLTDQTAPAETIQATLGTLPAQTPSPSVNPASVAPTTSNLVPQRPGTAPSQPPTVVATTEPKASIVPKAMEPLLLPEVSCAQEMDLAVRPDAIVELTLLAPCHPDERLVVRHGGLAITAKTTASGSAYLQLPALNVAGDVLVRFADSTEIKGNVAVPEAASLRRFAVDWMADDTFGVHAFENGAGYGDPGHVSAANPGKLPMSDTPTGGYLMILGEADVVQPMLAEVYTYPRDVSVPVEVSVEAEVTAATCGRELLGEAITSRAGTARVSDLALAMPDCTALGDVLVLNNLVSDLTRTAMK